MTTKSIHKNKTVLTIGLIIFIDNVGGGMIMPLLPILFMNSSVGLISTASTIDKSFYFGLSYMLFPIISIISNPYLGYLSDYKGRKFIITLGMFGFICSNLITIISIITHNLWLFLLTRLMLGFFGGCYTAATAALMDISSNAEEKTKNIKLITLISILGFILSPAFSLLVPNKLTTLSLTIPFVIVFLLSIVNLLFILLFFPNIQTSAKEIVRPKITNIIATSFSFIFTNNNIFILSFIFFVFQLGYNFYFQILALELEQWHGFSISSTGFFFFVMGMCYSLGMYIVHPFFNRRFTDELITNISVIISAVIVIILSINAYFNITVLILWIFNIIFFLIIPMVSINIYKQFINISKENQGLVMGVAGQITSFALILSGLMISLHVFIGKLSLLATSIMLIIIYIFKCLFKQKI